MLSFEIVCGLVELEEKHMAVQKRVGNVVYLFPPALEAVTELGTGLPGCMSNQDWFDFTKLEHQLVATGPMNTWPEFSKEEDDMGWWFRFWQLYI